MSVMHGATPPPASQIAPEEIQDQIEALEKSLKAHRATMTAAKKAHEDNLQRAIDLRRALADIERSNMSSDFSALIDRESDLMNSIQNLSAKLGAMVSRKKGGR